MWNSVLVVLFVLFGSYIMFRHFAMQYIVGRLRIYQAPGEPRGSLRQVFIAMKCSDNQYVSAAFDNEGLDYPAILTHQQYQSAIKKLVEDQGFVSYTEDEKKKYGRTYLALFGNMASR